MLARYAAGALPGERRGAAVLNRSDTSRFEPYRAERAPGLPLRDFRVRPAAAQDCESIAQIAVERDGGSFEKALDLARRQVTRSLENQDFLVLVAETGGTPGEDEVAQTAEVSHTEDSAKRVVAYGRAGFHRWLAPEDESVPEGGYLLGVNVTRGFRRQGSGRELTVQRLKWLSGRTDTAYYFANSTNQASIVMHAEFGFVEVARDIRYPGVTFDGVGVLFRANLPAHCVHRATEGVRPAAATESANMVKPARIDS